MTKKVGADDIPTGLLCSESTDCGQGERCVPRTEKVVIDAGYDVQRFGDLGRACTDSYFEYVHDYTCDSSNGAAFATIDSHKTSGLITENTKNALAAQGLSGDKSVCVYKPRVQVLDNWGWCNGEAGDQYYNNHATDSDLCLWSKTDPWLSYQGEIIVIPN